MLGCWHILLILKHWQMQLHQNEWEHHLHTIFITTGETFHMNFLYIFTDNLPDECNVRKSHGSKGQRWEESQFNVKGKIIIMNYILLKVIGDVHIKKTFQIKHKPSI